MLLPRKAALESSRRNASRLLVLTDDPSFIERVAAVFRSNGANEIYASGDTRLYDGVLANRGEFDIIILDLDMPEVDGVNFVHELARLDCSCRLILVSGERECELESAKRLAAMLGINRVAALSKPLDFDELAAIVTADMPHGARCPMPSVDVEAINTGLRNSCLIASYQPRIDVKTGALAGTEVSARIRSDTGDLLDAGQMINLAEENSRLSDITWRLIEIISQEAPCLFAEIGENFRVSFNISGLTLANPQFPDHLADLIMLSGMKPENFVLELTEPRIPYDPVRALELLTRLRVHGFGLAVDDFGTGNANIDRLRVFPFAELKIDRNFIAVADAGAFSRACLRTGLELACELGLRTVVEGVDSPEMLDLARELGIDEAQGRLFGESMEVCELVTFAARGLTTQIGDMSKRKPATRT